MPRYFFNFHNIGPHTDDEGAVLQDDEAACKEVTKAAAEMPRDMDGQFSPRWEWAVEVTDENLNPIYMINISTQIFA